MARIGILAIFAGTALVLAGCQSAGSGLSTGAVRAFAPAPGLTKGPAGGRIGHRLSAADRRAALAAERRALELRQSGASVTWRGRSGSVGEVVVGPQYQVNDYDCRDFTHIITIAGKTETARATACRQPGGGWTPVT